MTKKRRINTQTNNASTSRGIKIMPSCKKCGSELPEGAAYCPKCGTPIEHVAELKLAFWGERFVAWLIDLIILSMILIPVRLFIWAAWPGYAWAPSVPRWVPFVDFGTSNLVYFLYWMLSEGLYDQSIGKMIMRIKVTRLDGKPANMAQAAIESVGKAFLLPLDCIIGWLFYLSKRQRLFNHISGTIVIRV
jgi:uncharacterized RDD family membrane protein YckC